MEKRNKIIWGLGCILIVLFFLGACGKKEETPKKPTVVRKMVVSKKISKPAPKKAKKAKPVVAGKPKDASESKEKPKSKQAKTDTDTGEKEKVTTETLAAKKKPAFEPKSEISEESDFNKESASGVKVAKKEDSKATGPSNKPQTEKDGKTEKDEKRNPGKGDAKQPPEKKSKPDEKRAKVKPDKDSGTSAKESTDNSKKDKPKETTAEKEGASATAKDSEETRGGNEQIAGISPSKTLTHVKIPPLSQEYQYRPEGKIDPFSSLFQVKSEKKKKRKRFPLTPLEKKDISQFKLVGVILSAKGNKAIVKESSGKGYVVQRGTYIGVNDGRVVKILKDRVICEEEVENLFGQIEIKSRVLKLNKPPGAL